MDRVIGARKNVVTAALSLLLADLSSGTPVPPSPSRKLRINTRITEAAIALDKSATELVAAIGAYSTAADRVKEGDAL